MGPFTRRGHNALSLTLSELRMAKAGGRGRKQPPCIPEIQALISAMHSTDGTALDARCMELSRKVEECIEVERKRGRKPPTMYHMMKFQTR